MSIDHHEVPAGTTALGANSPQMMPYLGLISPNLPPGNSIHLQSIMLYDVATLIMKYGPEMECKTMQLQHRLRWFTMGTLVS